MKPSSGYSGTPLIKKLGIREGMKVLVLNPPKEYREWLGPLPVGASFTTRAVQGLLFVHAFVRNQKAFEAAYLSSKAVLDKTGMLWISWPKKSSGLATDLNEDIIRDFALANGLVDVKVCAVSEVWSALKLVYRLKDR